MCYFFYQVHNFKKIQRNILECTIVFNSVLHVAFICNLTVHVNIKAFCPPTPTFFIIVLFPIFPFLHFIIFSVSLFNFVFGEKILNKVQFFFNTLNIKQYARCMVSINAGSDLGKYSSYWRCNHSTKHRFHQSRERKIALKSNANRTVYYTKQTNSKLNTLWALKN